MAKTRKVTQKKRRPYLFAAVFCEKVLEEKDRVLSAIRIVDRLTIAPDPPGLQVPSVIPIVALIGFKSGGVHGQFALKATVTMPSGKKKEVLEAPILFEGPEEGGANIRINMLLEAKEEGVYWFDVMLDNRRFTRMPLRIVFQKENDETKESNGRVADIRVHRDNCGR